MFLVLIKFVEVFTRAGMVVGVAYSLGLADAGRFGVTTTLIGLFAFAFNWERQVDIQRRTVGQSDAALDRAIKDAITFWGFNQAVMLPVFVLTAAVLARLSPLQLALAAVIVSGEHVANQTYQVSLLARRYWSFLLIVAAKNALVLLVMLPYILFAPSRLTLTFVLAGWAIGQAVCVGVVAWQWCRRSRPASATRTGFDGRILSQHRASLTHFKLGIVAILSLQFDRLTVGALAPLTATGTYFRHVLIVSFVYQFVNVASYNRILPRVFEAARTEPVARLLVPIRRELAMMVALVVAGVVVALVADAATGHAMSARYHLSVTLALLLLTGALIRVTADFASLICNARHQERAILRNQLMAFLIGGSLLVALTLGLGIVGTAIANVVTAGIYLTLMVRTVRRLPQQSPVPTDAPTIPVPLESGL